MIIPLSQLSDHHDSATPKINPDYWYCEADGTWLVLTYVEQC